MAAPLTVYLAGPDVFLPDAIALGERKKQLCARYGFEGLYPLDDTVSAAPGAGPPDRLIYRACVALLRRADFGIVNLTPFRGPSADAGTVYELGMLIGLGKTVFGYTNVTADLLERVQRSDSVTRDTAEPAWRDSDGMLVEDFGNADNLMIDAALAEQGHEIVRIAAPPADRFRDLTGFEACLQRAADHFAGDRAR
jgi:nucleoside 2-deoxyribosyltransferase